MTFHLPFPDANIAHLRHRMFRLALKLTGNEDSADDVTQAAWLRICLASDRYQDQGNLWKWLSAILRHEYINFLRSLRRDSRLRSMHYQGSSFPDPQAEAATKDMAHQVLAVVASLPEVDRKILKLRYIDARSSSQISRDLRMPLGTVLSRAHRAIGQLRRRLAG